MKEQITLKFPSLLNLWAFKSAVNSICFELNPGNLTLICDCSKEHTELAIKKYNAIVVESKIQVAL
jgi:hypothetical protein